MKNGDKKDMNSAIQKLQFNPETLNQTKVDQKYIDDLFGINNKEKPLFEKFPKQFEVNLVKLIIDDRNFAAQMQEVLELSYFKGEYLKYIVNAIFSYKEKYGTHPAYETVDMLLHSLKDIDQINKNLIMEFWEPFKKDKKVEDPEYFMKIALDFCRSQKIQQAVASGIADLKNANIDDFMEKITKAASLGTSQNFGHDYKEDFEKRYEKDLRDTITLGDPILDEKTNGGISNGELFVYVSPRSKGKTSRLVQTGTKNLINGKNVLYFHMEMQSEEIGQKFDSCLTKIYLKELKQNKDTIRKSLKDLPGQLKIIEEEYCATTPRRIFNKCKKMEDSGFKVDLVIIDYMDLLIPSKALRDDDGSVGGIQVYAETKNLTKKYNFRTLTAAQTNREGSEVEVITNKHFEGRIARFNPCDFVVGFSAFGKASVLKTRIGEDGWVLDEERDLGRVYTKLKNPNSDDMTDNIIKNNGKKTIDARMTAKMLNDLVNSFDKDDK